MDKQDEQNLAWVGDAVLALFSREWILRHYGKSDGAMQARMTSNQFLSCLGQPTSFEAEIGALYRKEGLAAAFARLETLVVPLFLKQERNRAKP
jgi:23S rRNA maturation mini-RNase III